MTFPFLAERYASREWNLEQRGFNGRQIKKVLDSRVGDEARPHSPPVKTLCELRC
jgi:hypothetical protein